MPTINQTHSHSPQCRSSVCSSFNVKTLLKVVTLGLLAQSGLGIYLKSDPNTDISQSMGRQLMSDDINRMVELPSILSSPTPEYSSDESAESSDAPTPSSPTTASPTTIPSERPTSTASPSAAPTTSRPTLTISNPYGYFIPDADSSSERLS